MQYKYVFTQNNKTLIAKQQTLCHRFIQITQKQCPQFKTIVSSSISSIQMGQDMTE